MDFNYHNIKLDIINNVNKFKMFEDFEDLLEIYNNFHKFIKRHLHTLNFKDPTENIIKIFLETKCVIIYDFIKSMVNGNYSQSVLFIRPIIEYNAKYLFLMNNNNDIFEIYNDFRFIDLGNRFSNIDGIVGYKNELIEKYALTSNAKFEDWIKTVFKNLYPDKKSNNHIKNIFDWLIDEGILLKPAFLLYKRYCGFTHFESFCNTEINLEFVLSHTSESNERRYREPIHIVKNVLLSTMDYFFTKYSHLKDDNQDIIIENKRLKDKMYKGVIANEK